MRSAIGLNEEQIQFQLGIQYTTFISEWLQGIIKSQNSRTAEARPNWILDHLCVWC